MNSVPTFSREVTNFSSREGRAILIAIVFNASVCKQLLLEFSLGSASYLLPGLNSILKGTRGSKPLLLLSLLSMLLATPVEVDR